MEKGKGTDRPVLTQAEETERLRRAVGDLQAQNNVLSERLREAQMSLSRSRIGNAVKRIELLFSCLDHCGWFGREFMERCAAEIEEMMDIKEGESVENKENKENSGKIAEE